MVNNESLSYSIEVSGENNIYTWYKEGVLLLDQTTNTLYLENTSYDDQGTYVLKVTNTIVPDLELVSYNAELSIVTGMDKFDITDFRIYPNPAVGNKINIIVENPDQVASFQIINATGQAMTTEQLSNRNNTVDISDLTNGVYIVKIAYKNDTYQIEKLIVK